jgi:hypothetical protein
MSKKKLEEMRKLIESREAAAQETAEGLSLEDLQALVANKEADQASFKDEPQGFLARKAIAPAQGFNRGLAYSAGAPVDLMTYGLEGGAQVPIGEAPVMGSEWLKENVMPAPVMQERGVLERLGGRIGEELGAAAVPFLGIMRKVATTTRMIKAGTKNTGIMKELVDSLSGIPLRKLVRMERRAAMGAGAMRSVAEEAGFDDPLSIMVAQLTGALTPAGASAVLKYAVRKSRKVLPAVTKKGVKARVSDELYDWAEKDPSFMAELEASLEMQKEFPNAPLTLPEATLSSKPVALQKELSRIHPELVDELAQLNATRNAGLKAVVEEALQIPLHATDTDITRALRSRMNWIEAKMGEQIRKAEMILDDKLVQFGDEMKPADAGRIIRKQLLEARRVFREEATAVYTAIDPQSKVIISAKNGAPGTRPIIKATQNIYEGWQDAAEGTKGMPGIIKRIARLLIDDPAIKAQQKGALEKMLGRTTNEIPLKDVPFNQLVKIRADILMTKREIGTGLSEVGALKQRKLAQLLDSVDETMDQLTMNAAGQPYTPEQIVQRYGEQALGVRDRFDQARGFYKEGMEKFDRGAARRVQQIRRSEPVKVDVQVAGEFLKAGNIGEDTAKNFVNALGGNAEAEEALFKYALHEIRRVATKDIKGVDELIPGKMRLWLKRHKAALEHFPKIKKQLTDFHDLQLRLESTQGRMQVAQATRQDETFRLFLQGAEPSNIMRDVLRHPRGEMKLRQLKRKIRQDPDAVEGLKRAFFKAMIHEFEGRTIDRFRSRDLNSRNMRNFLDTKRGFLRQIFSTEDLKWIDKMVNFQERLRISGELTPAEIKINVLQEPWRFNLSYMLSRGWGIARNVIGKTYVGSDVAIRTARSKAQMFQQREAAELFHRALMDPKVSRDLILFAQPGKQTGAYNRLRAHLANLGGAERFEEDKDYDVKITGSIPNQD